MKKRLSTREEEVIRNDAMLEGNRKSGECGDGEEEANLLGFEEGEQQGGNVVVGETL